MPMQNDNNIPMQNDDNVTITTGINRATGNYLNPDLTPVYKLFQFKSVDGGFLTKYEVNINATMEEFLTIIKELIANILGVYNQQQDFHIIEAGQFNNINGRDAELAPELQPSNILFKDYFGKRINTTAFYIRYRNN